MKLLIFAVATLWAVTACAGTVLPSSPLRQAPRLVKLAGEELPEAELIATPEVRVLLGYTRRVLQLPDGHTLAVFSFSSSAPANWLFLIDGRDLSVQRYAIPNNDVASHGAALGRDGNIYLMPYNSGRAYRFEVPSRSFEPIQVDLPAGEYTWDAIGASNGCIYFGTYPNAIFGEFNPATGKTTLWKQVAPESTYISDLSEDNSGRVRLRAWGPGSTWMTFDLRDRELKPAGPPEPDGTSAEPMPPAGPPRGDERFQSEIVIGDQRFGLSFPSGRFWEIDSDGTSRFCGDPKDPATGWWLQTVRGRVVGISHFGALFRFDAATGRFIRRDLPNRVPGGNAIMFIEAIAPGCVIGANYSQQNLFKIDPVTGQIEQSRCAVARVPGEPMCAVGLGGRAYLGIYISSILSVYDPGQPFAYGINPQELIQLEPAYQQTRPRDAVTDGQLVFISSDSSYSHLGGALAVIDPQTGKVAVYHHLIRDQNLPTLAYDPSTGLLWGGTDRWGQMRSHPPTQSDSLLYAFDIAHRQVVARLTPWKGTDVTSVLGISTNGILIASSGDQIALIDTSSREMLYQGVSPIGIPGKLRRGSDGCGYCLAGRKLFRWDFTGNVLSPVANASDCHLLTESAPGTWVLANRTSLYRLQLPRVTPGDRLPNHSTNDPPK